jgi:iron complex transport system substrate-binding protein
MGSPTLTPTRESAIVSQSSPVRIATLLPAATEIVAALGLVDRLVGRSHECDSPAGVRDLPALTAARIEPDQDSRAIHDAVTARAEQALSIFDIDWGAMRACAPDLIVTQDQCAACGVTLADLGRDVSDALGKPVKVVALAPADLDDVWQDVRRVADAVGLPAVGVDVAGRLAARIADLRARTRELSRPTVATLDWIDPLMAGGNWMPTLVDAAGGRDPLGTPGGHAPMLAWADLRRADPDVLAAMPCGFDIAQARADMCTLENQSGWSDLTAVRNGRVAITDGNAFFNRPGPRLLESAEILAEILHPEHFAFGHAGRNWLWLPVN